MIIDGFIRAKNNFPNEKSTCLEFGVYVGGTYSRLVDCILDNYPDTTLIGFDSWSGLPPETEGVWYPDRHSQGNYASTKDSVLNMLISRGLEYDERFKLVDGFFEETLTPKLQSEINNLVFVNVDVDIHKSTEQLLEFIHPMLRKGVVLYFDDWKDPADNFDGKWGEHLAWEQFIERHPEIEYETIQVNEYNQRLIEIK